MGGKLLGLACLGFLEQLLSKLTDGGVVWKLCAVDHALVDLGFHDNPLCSPTPEFANLWTTILCENDTCKHAQEQSYLL